MAARKTPETPGASGPGKAAPSAGRPGGGRTPTDSGSKLGWIGLAVAAVLTAWQVIYAITSPGVANGEAYTSVWLLLSLVLAVGAVVLGIVALGQHAVQRWPATAALAVGVYAFIVAVATWIGGLLSV